MVWIVNRRFAGHEIDRLEDIEMDVGDDRVVDDSVRRGRPAPAHSGETSSVVAGPCGLSRSTSPVGQPGPEGCFSQLEDRPDDVLGGDRRAVVVGDRGSAGRPARRGASTGAAR